uniref:Helicase C-terminal domain-containing protein n=1 Tax=Physcomitrium patens TaxID=3218 RepID=A0A7I4FVT3_PHYPA
MTFWDGTYGAEAFTKIVRIKQDNKIKYTLNEEVVQRLRRNNLHLYSCKYSKMLDIIESNKDMLAFVFCEEVKGTGLIMMSCIFELFGYQLYDGENIDEIEKGLRYTLYTRDIVACSNPEKRLDGFRSPKNKYGEYVKILLDSRISGESVSLTNVRQVHIITPHWNKSKIVQAIGRAVRSRSHDLLKAEERSIHVYRHVALACKSNKCVPSLISEEKSKRIEDVENVIRSCCIDYYLNVDTTTVRSGFCDDISTYLLWYCNDIEASIREIVTRSTEALSIGAISTLLSTKKSVVKALIGKGISLDNGTRIKEIKGMVYLDSVTTSNRDKHFSSFKQRISVSINYFTKVIYEDKRDLIHVVSSMTMSQKVHLLESAILSGKRNASLFFENSFDCINDKYYHILSYRTAEDNYSYSLSSESFKACMKTRVLDGTWTTVSAEDELDIIQKIISKSKRSREIMETKHKIYAIFSNGDNRFRIRNSLSENKERSLKDLRNAFQSSGSKGKSAIPFAGKRVGISYKAENGIEYPLILAPKGCMFYSFGIQDDSFSGSSNKGSKSMCISIGVEDNKDTNENAFCANVHAIYDRCKEYIMKHPKDVGIKVSKDTIDDMFKHPLKEFTKDGITTMRMYAKLIVSNKDSKVWTTFYDTKQNKVDAKSLEGVHCRMYPALLFDSLYFWSGSRASLQCKLSEAVVELVDRATPSLDMSLLKIRDEKENI